MVLVPGPSLITCSSHSFNMLFFLLLASNFYFQIFRPKMASYIGKFTFRLSVTGVTYNFYIRQPIAKSRSKNCPYKVKMEKLKEKNIEWST